MKTLTKPFRAVIRDGLHNEGWSEEQSGQTMLPDDVQAFEADTLDALVGLLTDAGVSVSSVSEERETEQVSAAPTLEDYERAVEDVLQECATNHRYDDIVSACSYAAVENPFQAESAALLAWRGNVWAWCYGLLANPPAALPTVAEFRASLLAAWPMP